MSTEKRWTQTDITALRGRLEGGETAVWVQRFSMLMVCLLA